MLLAASEEAAERGVEVAYWEFVHREFLTDGIRDIYEAELEEQYGVEEGEVCKFTVEVTH